MADSDWLRAPIADALAKDLDWIGLESDRRHGIRDTSDLLADVIVTALLPVIDAHYVPREEYENVIDVETTTLFRQRENERERAERAEARVATLTTRAENAEHLHAEGIRHYADLLERAERAERELVTERHQVEQLYRDIHELKALIEETSGSPE